MVVLAELRRMWEGTGQNPQVCSNVTNSQCSLTTSFQGRRPCGNRDRELDFIHKVLRAELRTQYHRNVSYCYWKRSLGFLVDRRGQS